jgi:dTDP-4-dehydrorhamnose reductase
MKQRVLITGGSGLLALNWALAVKERFSITLGLHNRNVMVPEVQTQNIDLGSLGDLCRSLEVLEPHVVIHTAGLTSVELCESNPALAAHVNVLLATNVAKVCARLGIKLVHVSTDHLFSGLEALVDENHPVSPLNVYGKTKAEAENRVLESNPLALVIRTNFYGWGTSYRHSFSDLIFNALRAKTELTLFQDVFYTPILIGSVVSAVHDLLAIDASGVFNVVGDERISKYHFGLRLAEEFELDPRGISPGLLSARASHVRRPQDMSLSNHKVCSLLGRQIGGVQMHMASLHQQELNGHAQKIGKL